MQCACVWVFTDILRRNRERIRKGGVVHSFTGSVAEMEECVALGFHIGTSVVPSLLIE